MYDAWAAYSPTAVGVFHNETATAADIEAARHEAISYAAYWVLITRYSESTNAEITEDALETLMASLGYPTGSPVSTGNSPQAVGTRAAIAVLIAGNSDQSNESDLYVDDFTGYQPFNEPLDLAGPGTGTLADPNRWQPLKFEVAMTQNGQTTSATQVFVGSHWGYVTPFALSGEVVDGVYTSIDPGPPPFLGGAGDEDYKQYAMEVIRYSSFLDPTNPDQIDISPGAHGNNPLGTNDGIGHPNNPVTGQPYAQNLVKHADYGRVVAEFWADGPHSETPPGHWNVLANEIKNHPNFSRKLQGVGPELGELEWDVKLYLALNAALHDSAIATWGVKAYYDYVRPITAIRHLGFLGQSSDSNQPNYHPSGLPLEPGVVELVTAASSQPGERHEGLPVGQLVIKAWLGEPEHPDSQAGGVGWMLADNWKPYQRSTFVTPAFAGYVSGHSTFSRAAAEVLTVFTGSAYFPGGLGTHTVQAGDLEFEVGPATDVTLQWATYYDAADQAGISRLYGGIHVAADDGPGRIVGSKVGKAAVAKALLYENGEILDDFKCEVVVDGNERTIKWNCIPGYIYQVQWSDSLDDESFQNLTTPQTYSDASATVVDSTATDGHRFYRVRRQAP
ncbi:vanadium-dependent haloperoxidase [Oceaniferula spumae]